MTRVLIVGAMPSQVSALRNRLPRDVETLALDCRKALRARSLGGDLIICSRFIGHKHQLHLERITGAPVVFCSGGAASWINCILSWCKPGLRLSNRSAA